MEQRSPACLSVVQIGRGCAIQLSDKFVSSVGTTSIQVASDEIARNGRQLCKANGSRASSSRHVGRGVRYGTLVPLNVHKRQAIVVGAGEQRAASDRRLRDQTDRGRLRLDQQSAGRPLDQQILAEYVDDIGIVEPSRHGHRPDRVSGWCLDANEQSVDTVSKHRILIDIGTDTVIVGGECDFLMTRSVEVGLFKTIRTRRDRGIGTARDRVEGDCRPRVDDVNWIDDLGDRVNDDISATIADVGIIDVVQEDAFFVIDKVSVAAIVIIAEEQTAPVSRQRCRGERESVRADRLVVIGREEDIVLRGAENLQRSAAAIDARCRTANADSCSTQLKHSAFVDHHGHTTRNLQCRSVAQGLTKVIESNLVGHPVGKRAVVAIRIVADNSDDVTSLRSADRVNGRGAGQVIEGV